MTDAPRRPLVPLAPELRRKLLAARGLDEAMLPLTLTDAERRAAQSPGLPARMQEPHMQPVVSEKFAALAAAIATALAGAAALAPQLTFLPPWAPFALWCLAAVAAYLAGKALPPFAGASPSLPQWLVPLLKSVAAVLTGYAASLPVGSALQGVVMLAATLAGALAGKVEPQAMVPPSFLPPPPKE